MTELRTSPVTDLERGLQILGYRFLPVGGFDAAGNLKMPDDFKLPDAWSATVGRVTASPDWEDLLSILGVLATPGSDWSCWKIALSFRDGTLRVVLVRGGTMSAAGSQVALNWANNVWPRIGSLRDYAGRRRVLPEGLTDAVSTVAGDVKDSPYWDKKLPDKKQQKAFEAQKLRVHNALDLLIDVAKFIATITTKSKVLATVLWYDAQRPSVPSSQVAWQPLHQIYNGFNLRAVHYWWNSGWDSTSPPSYPFVFSSTVPRRGWSVTDVAHEPWELAGAFYPNGSWAPPRPPTPVRHRECDESSGRRICWWEPGPAALLEEDAASGEPADAGAGPGFEPPDLSALQGSALPGSAPPAEVEPAESEPEAIGAVAGEDEPEVFAPLVLAYGVPPEDDALIAAGRIEDGVWYPLADEEEAAVPDLIALPALGIVASADSSCKGWRPSGQLPSAAALSPAASPSAPQTPPR